MTESLLEAFGRLALYNLLANQRLYEACAALPDDERKRRRRAFFGSIHGTLNHVMVGDRIWLARFAGQSVPSSGLDAILYEDFEELSHARSVEDARIVAFANSLSAVRLDETVTYVNNAGQRHEDPLSLLVLHMFNHQTHHRGQVHDMLSQTGVPPPSLDLHRVLRPDPIEAEGKS